MEKIDLSGEILDELAEMHKRFSELYRSTGLVGFTPGSGMHSGVQLTENAFVNTFAKYDSADRYDEEYPTELYAEHNGVRFFCIR